MILKITGIWATSVKSALGKYIMLHKSKFSQNHTNPTKCKMQSSPKAGGRHSKYCISKV